MTTRNWDEMSAGTWTIHVRDAFAQVSGTWTDYTLNIYGTTATQPAGLTCASGTTVPSAAGIATFTGCTVPNPGLGYTLSASATGLTAGTSIGFDIYPQSYDATCDGKVTANDTLALLGALAGLTSGVPQVPPGCNPDPNGDSVLSLPDALTVRRALAGLVDWP